MGSKRFSITAVVLSVIGGLLAFLVGELLLHFGEEWPAYLRMGLYFGVGAMFIAALLLISQWLSPQLIGYRWKQQYFKTSLKLFIPVTLLMLGLSGGLFQFLYGMNVNKEKAFKDIVIAIDTSGSMEQSDPNGERFKATSSLIDNLEGNRRIAFMTFDDSPILQFDFMEATTKEQKEVVKAKIASYQQNDDGQTGVRDMINEAYELIQNNSKNHSGSLIMISDGAPSDDSASNIPGLVSSYVQNNIPIYTIGMMYGDNSAEQYLIDIANLTGGQHYSTSDTTMIAGAFGQIRYDEGKRELMTERSDEKAEVALYMVLRVGFLTILAFLMALALGIMFDNRFLAKGLMIGGTLGGLIGGIVVEMLFKQGTTPYMVRLGYWLMFGLCLATFTGLITFKDSYHGTREA